MVGFSCLSTHIACHKAKKDSQQYQEYNTQGSDANSLVLYNDVALEVNPVSDTSILEMEQSIHINEQQTSSLECCQEFQDKNEISYPQHDKEILRSSSLRKTQSVGSGLFRHGRYNCAETDDEADQESAINFEDEFERLGDNSGLQEHFCSVDAGIDILNQNQGGYFETNALPNCSTFFIDDTKQFDDEFYKNVEHGFPDHVIATNQMSNTPVFSKSHSLPNMGAHESPPICRLMHHRSRSVENLCSETRKTGYVDSFSRMLFNQFRRASQSYMPEIKGSVGGCVHLEADIEDRFMISSASKEQDEVLDREEESLYKGNHIFDNELNGDSVFHDVDVLLNDYKEPEMDDLNHASDQMEGHRSWQDLNNENFNMKRIEEWIRQIDIHESGIPQEVGESSSPTKEKEHHLNGRANTSRLFAKGNGGFEVVQHYISTLAPASTSVHMTNLGIVVIPSLSTFSSLRVLNLSCNAIVKITSGALPRGLHMLNLSRNNITTIEGLRELTRLRVLDLSYNRILRVGHGLAGCSSLKELYLAGNKISEVEGLHRLLKLNILDLRYNKICTAKCLGQLAANYASLQAINLEGNPAQRNVGEEQLKRYIHGLLPRLLYFNKHIIKSSSSRELSDRTSRSITPRQFDRSARASDHKRSRRGSHAVATPKLTPTSHHSRVSQSTGYPTKPHRNRDRHTHLPPPGSREYHLPRVDSKLLGDMQPLNPMRRSRSEGNF